MTTFRFAEQAAKDVLKLPHELQRNVFELPARMDADAHSGSHLELIREGMYTVRVNRAVRAVLVPVGGDEYVVLRVCGHDETYRFTDTHRPETVDVAGTKSLEELQAEVRPRGKPVLEQRKGQQIVGLLRSLLDHKGEPILGEAVVVREDGDVAYVTIANPFYVPGASRDRFPIVVTAPELTFAVRGSQPLGDEAQATLRVLGVDLSLRSVAEVEAAFAGACRGRRDLVGTVRELVEQEHKMVGDWLRTDGPIRNTDYREHLVDGLSSRAARLSEGLSR